MEKTLNYEFNTYADDDLLSIDVETWRNLLDGTDPDSFMNKLDALLKDIEDKSIEVIEKATFNELPETGEVGKIYIVYADPDATKNAQYRWTGSEYANIAQQMNYATDEEAVAGIDDTKVMTPAKTKLTIESLGSGIKCVTKDEYDALEAAGETNENSVYGVFDDPDYEALNVKITDKLATKLNITDTTKKTVEDAIDVLADIPNKINNPNLLINGGFDIWQRGTDFNFAGGVQYGADMWYNLHQHIKYTRVANTSPICCDYALRVTNANDGSIDGGGWGTVLQKIEKNYVGKILTLSAYVRSINGSFEFSMGDWDVNNVLKKTISNKWEYLKHVFVMGNSNTISFGSQLKLADTTKGYEIAGVKLELGDIATPFAPVNYGEELARCQRYYEKGFALFTHPISANIGDAIFTPKIQYCTAKRIIPTINFKSNGSQVLENTFYANGAGTQITGNPAFVYNSLDGFNINLANIQQSIAQGESLSFTWEASAEL